MHMNRFTPHYIQQGTRESEPNLIAYTTRILKNSPIFKLKQGTNKKNKIKRKNQTNQTSYNKTKQNYQSKHKKITQTKYQSLI